MVRVDEWNIERLLVLEPHADDGILMAAGLTIKVAESGGEVCYLTLTNGGAARKDSEKLKQERKEESQEADKILGVSKRIILPYDTRALHDNHSDAYNDLLQHIRQFRPDTIVTMHEDYNHPDHMWSAQFSRPARFQASEPIRPDWGSSVCAALLYGENPRSTLQVRPDLYLFVVIDHEIQRKITAMKTQISQFPILGKTILDDISTLAAFRAMNAYPINRDIKFCEAFQIMYKQTVFRDK